MEKKEIHKWATRHGIHEYMKPHENSSEIIIYSMVILTFSRFGVISLSGP